MKLHDFDQEYKVYYSALDRIVKKIDEKIYETYHITVVEEEKVLTINTVDFTELPPEDINQYLVDCGLKYMSEDQKIVQKHNESEVVEADPDKMPYILADRLSISGYINDTYTFNFRNASELNEILLEQDIPIRFKNSTLKDL